MQKRKPFRARLPLYFFILSMLSGVINFIIVGDTDPSTPGVAETPLTIWVFMAILFFCLSLMSFGFNLIYFKKFFSSSNLFGISMILIGLSFLAVMINGPILGNDLNEPLNLTFGIIFALSILGIIISQLSKISKDWKKMKKVVFKLEQLREEKKDDKVFFCYEFWAVDEESMQLFGESFNTPVEVGMNIEIGNTNLIIKEVYGSTEQPTLNTGSSPEGIPNTPIVVGILDVDWITLSEELEREKVLVFKLIN